MSFEIDKIAALARISLKPEEKDKLQKDMGKILTYIEKLKSVNTGSIEATSHVMDLENVFREDKVEPSEVINEVLPHAPSQMGRFFKIPKTVDK